MNKLQKLIRQFNLYIHHIQSNPTKTYYTKNEILNLRRNAEFRNPLLDTIETWERAGKPSKKRLKY